MTIASMFPPTPVRSTDVRLREYQLDAVSRIRARFEAGDRSTLLVLPTGCGKTVTFGYLARAYAQEHDAKTLVLAHRGELIDQAADSLSNLGLSVAIEQADQRGMAYPNAHAVIATVQTMQRKRLASWPRDYFGLMVTDEAHHAVSDSYQNIYEHFAGTPHLGVTATADRGDKINLGVVFDSLAYEYTLLDALTAPPPGPYLSRLRVVQCNVEVDLSAIRTTAGDLNAADLQAALLPHVTVIANAVRQEIGTRSTLIFTPDVGAAQAIATGLQAIDVKADWIAGDDPDRERKLRDYKDGALQVLVNCALLTEGFDAPRTSAIVNLRPTKSRALFAQIIGRGTRLYPGKEDCIIVDFAWICGKHQLVKPVELIASRLASDEAEEEEIRKRASKLMEDGEVPDLLDAIEKAKADMEEAARQLVLRMNVNKLDLKYRRVSYDPLAGYHAIGLPTKFPREARPEPATEKQVALLKKLGIPGAETLSKKRASLMIESYMPRIHQGLASYKQVNWLIANGYDAKEVGHWSMQRAGEELDKLWGKRK
jgi:superfamily II DNA or RNA helicase